MRENGIGRCARRMIILMAVVAVLTAGITRGREADAGPPPGFREAVEIGRSHYLRGDFREAARTWERALAGKDAGGGPSHSLLLHLADAYQRIGFHRKGAALLQKALADSAHDDPKAAALFHAKLGDIRLSMGWVGQAAEEMSAARDSADAAGDPFALATALNGLGNARYASGDPAEALSAYDRALANLCEPAEDEPGHGRLRARIRINASRTHLDAGEPEAAVRAIRDAWTAAGGLPENRETGEILVALGTAAGEIGRESPRHSDPLSEIRYRALVAAGRIGDRLGDDGLSTRAWGTLGGLYEDRGRVDEAMALTRRAVFHAQQGPFHKSLYQWQWRLGRLLRNQGRIPEAMAAFRDATRTLTPIRGELIRERRRPGNSFRLDIRPVYLGLARLLISQAETATDASVREENLMEARDTMEELKTAELENFFKDECVNALQSRMTRLDRAPAHTAVIYPIVFPDAVSILLTLPDRMDHIPVALDGEALRRSVERYRGQLQAMGGKRYHFYARRLYDWLIKPLEPTLAAHKVRTLVVAPDGVLRLIPFSTLHDGRGFLVERYAVVTIPGITLTDLSKAGLARVSALLAGLSEARQGFSPLPAVPEELADIREILGGTVLLNAAYTYENLLEAFRSRAYSVVHLATHGEFGGDAASTFLLTSEGRLKMDLLEELIGVGRFRKTPVELLSLSACQTALGDERSALGLAGVAVKAGARSALATLWSVDDEATAEAVRRFYSHLHETGGRKAQALQQAQIALIQQDTFDHPAFWGPFLLIGNWL